ncbi:MAG: hypothetical protein AAF934_03400, partial [Bacteroidota bacterium]
IILNLLQLIKNHLMFVFFTILFILFIINGLLLLFSVYKMEKNTSLTTDLHVLNKSNRKEEKPEEKPAYSIYKKAM